MSKGRLVSPADDTRRLERRVWFMGRFTVSTLARPSVPSLLQHLDDRNDIETVLRLSAKGLSWGTQGSSWWRPWHRPLPFASVELSSLDEVFPETSQPRVLICVERPVRGTYDSSYQVFAFRLRDVDDAVRFQKLFQHLTNPERPAVKDAVATAGNNGEMSPSAVRPSMETGKRMDDGSPNARLVSRPSMETENRMIGNNGDGSRREPRDKDLNSVALVDPNNNYTENNRASGGKAGSHHQPTQMIRSMSESVPPEDSMTTVNRLKFYSPQPIRRRDEVAAIRPSVVNSQITAETNPTYAVVAPRTGNGKRSVAERSKVTSSKSLSDDEDTKRMVISYYAEGGGGREPPKPMPRTKSSDQEMDVFPSQAQSYAIPARTVSPIQRKNYVIPERAVSPTRGRNYVFPERTVSPTRGKINLNADKIVSTPQRISHIDSSDISSERTITPTQMRNRITVESSCGPVRVYVPDYRSKDLDSGLDTASADSNVFRDKESLPRDGVISNVTPEVVEPPKPKPRHSIQARAVSPIPEVTPIQVKEKTVTPTKVNERSLSPTQLKERAVSPTKVKERTATPTKVTERSLSPTQVKERSVSPIKVNERTATPAQMRSDNVLERAITPISPRSQTRQNVEMRSAKVFSGPLRVYVPDRKSGIVPQKSLLKSRKDLDPEQQETTAIVDSGISRRQKKSLSFNPSVIVNETSGSAFSESESPDRQNTDAMVHRTSRNRHASWSDSEQPSNLSIARKRGMMRGLSLPAGVSSSYVVANAVRIRTVPDSTGREPDAWIDVRHGSSTNREHVIPLDHDHMPLDRSEQASGKFHRVRTLTNVGHIPVDAITAEDTGYDRRPGPVKSATQAVGAQAPDHPKGKRMRPGSRSRGHRRSGNFGRRSGEPPLLYASDTEDWARSRAAAANIAMGQHTGYGAQVVHQPKSPVVIGGGVHPSMTGKTTVTPNGRLVGRPHGTGREADSRTSRVEERGNEAYREEDLRKRGRSTQVVRRTEVSDEIINVPDDRRSVPVGRLFNSRRSQSVVDPRRGPTATDDHHRGIAPPNGYLPSPLMTRSRSAARPILVTRSGSYEIGTAQQLSMPVVGQFTPGGMQDEGRRQQLIRHHQSDQTQQQQLRNGGVSERRQRETNYF